MRNLISFKKDITIVTLNHSGLIYKSLNYFQNSENKEVLDAEKLKVLAKYFGYTTISWLYNVLTKANAAMLYPEHFSGEILGTTEWQKNKGRKSFDFQWWKVTEVYGKKGENIVERGMISQGFIVEKQVASVGYDFLIKNGDEELKVEVKTIRNKNADIFMSINEVSTAFKTSDYRVFIVLLIDVKNEFGECYEIIDPMTFFNINENVINEQFADNDYGISAYVSSLCIHLNESIFNSGTLRRVF